MWRDQGLIAEFDPSWSAWIGGEWPTRVEHLRNGGQQPFKSQKVCHPIPSLVAVKEVYFFENSRLQRPKLSIMKSVSLSSKPEIRGRTLKASVIVPLVT